MDLFVYGTLMDDDVRRRVIGMPTPSAGEGVAFVDGCKRVYVEGASFPVLVADPTGVVEGRLITGLGAHAVERLSRFEGRLFRLERLSVRLARGRTAEVECFMPVKGVKASAKEWNLVEWRRRHKRAFLGRLRG